MAKKPTAWNKFVKKHYKKHAKGHRSRRVIMKSLGVAFRKSKKSKKSR